MPNCNRCEYKRDRIDPQNPICQQCIENQLENQAIEAENFKRIVEDSIRIQRTINAINRRISWLNENRQNIIYWESIMEFLRKNEQALEYIRNWDRDTSVESIINYASTRSKKDDASSEGLIKIKGEFDRFI